jgi:hypothetical protein
VSVEQELEKLREESLNYAEGKREFAAVQFYLQRIVSECQAQWNERIKSHTPYRALLGQIHRQLKGEPVCLVTFNYDTLLEEAFSSLDRRFESIDAYVSGDDYKIIKPHGSVNWVREITGKMPANPTDPLTVANRLISVADGLEPSDSYYLIPERDRKQLGWILSYYSIPGKPGVQEVLPAIAIPLQRKREYACPKMHAQVLEECILRTDKLLIIGWKGAEENFLKLLSIGLKKGVPKMVVSSSRDSSEKILSTLQRFGIDGEKWRLGESGFSTEVQSGSIERFIRK